MRFFQNIINIGLGNGGVGFLLFGLLSGWILCIHSNKLISISIRHLSWSLCPVILSVAVLYLVSQQKQAEPSSFAVIGWADHNEKVDAIAKGIAAFMALTVSNDTKCVSISQRKHGSTTRSTAFKERCHSVDVEPLDSLIALDAADETVWIESNMKMEQIHDALRFEAAKNVQYIINPRPPIKSEKMGFIMISSECRQTLGNVTFMHILGRIGPQRTRIFVESDSGI